jgi:putative oxidoreductase
MSAIAAFLGRIFLALLFLYSGAMKLLDPSAAQGMLGSVGLPPQLAIPTGIFEVVAAVCLILGLMTRLASILLAAYVALTILFFNHDFGTFQGMVAALTHLALIGGLLVVFAYGHMRWSYDHMRATRRGEIATADANDRAHDAELRAARAEGAAQAAGVPVTDPEDRPKRKWF